MTTKISPRMIEQLADEDEALEQSEENALSEESDAPGANAPGDETEDDEGEIA